MLSESCRENIRRAFDIKVDEMCELLDGQIEQMQNKYPQNRIVSLSLL
jgi:DNA helicase TIP49 (TBP-interacting protein)